MMLCAEETRALGSERTTLRGLSELPLALGT